MADSRTTGSDNGSSIVGRVKQSATEQLTNQKDRAADGIGSVTQALRQSTQQLRNQQHDTIAKYVDQAADQVDRWCEQLRGKDVSEVFSDVQRLARRQPFVFVGSAFALGLIGARFLKSSGDGAGRDRDNESPRRQYGGQSLGISEAADMPRTTAGVAVSDADLLVSPPSPDVASPAPGGGAGASTRTRRTTSDRGERAGDRTDRSTQTGREKS